MRDACVWSVAVSAPQADVIVAGAGPGGAVAAHDLAQRGARVLLLDRCAFPRDKACGDAVSVDALEILEQLGLQSEIERWFSWGECLVTSPSGRGAACRGADELSGRWGLVARRTELDAALVRRAVAKGAELVERCTVKSAVVEDGVCVGVQVEQSGARREMRAPVVIAADGFHSTVGRSLGLVHRPAITAFAVRGYFEPRTPGGHEPTIELHLDRTLLPGYGWYFPVSKSVANVGVGMLKVPMKRRGVTLHHLFRDFIQTNTRLRERLVGARQIGRLRGAPLPMGPGPSHTLHAGCLFVGDAAGFVDALTGEGIGAAMRSGRMAAEVVADVLGRSELDRTGLSAYALRCRREFGNSMRAAWFLQRMLGTGFFVERLVSGAARRPALGSQMFGMVAGVLPKTAAFRPANVVRALL